MHWNLGTQLLNCYKTLSGNIHDYHEFPTFPVVPRLIRPGPLWRVLGWLAVLIKSFFVSHFHTFHFSFSSFTFSFSTFTRVIFLLFISHLSFSYVSFFILPLVICQFSIYHLVTLSFSHLYVFLRSLFLISPIHVIIYHHVILRFQPYHFRMLHVSPFQFHINHLSIDQFPFSC